jgi:hypothetical protein
MEVKPPSLQGACLLTYEVVVECLQGCRCSLLTPHAHKAKALALAAVPVTHHHHVQHLQAASSRAMKSAHEGHMFVGLCCRR